MRIVWILSAGAAADDNGSLRSPLASYRYRAAIPLKALRERGHECSWYGLKAGETIDSTHAVLQNADVAIFAKNHSEQTEVIALLERARAKRMTTVVDTCDDYFEAGHAHEPYYRALVERANVVTTSSERLASAIKTATGIGAVLVRDPFEGPRGAPRWSPQGRHVKALWFGTPLNIQSLITEALELPPKMKSYTLDVRVLTNECQGLEDAFRQIGAQSGGKLTLTFHQWSAERNWAELQECDLALIPVKQSTRFFLAKGPNRVVETLWAGRFVVANSMPAYDAFKDWAWIGDIAEGLEWALDHPREVVSRIGEAQRYIEQNYSPAAIAAEWEKAISLRV